jgi:hypothetical protein
MKAVLVIQFFLITYSCVVAQISFDEKAKEITRYIELNMSASDVKSTKVPVEFFVYDFSLDSTGTIISAKTLFLDSLSFISQARELATVIKSKYKFPKSRYRKLLVPVMIVHSGNDGEPTSNDLAILETVRVFDILSKTKLNDVFTSKHAVVQQME